MSRYRIAHVITRLCKGGAQENTVHTARLVDADRFDVDIVSGPTEGPEGSIEEAVRDAGIDLIREPHLRRNPSPYHDWKALSNLTKLFRKKQYHIVHTHTSKAGYIGRLAAARAGIPIVVHTPHGHVFHGYFSHPISRFYIALESYAAKKTDRIIVLTDREVEEHLAKGVGQRRQYKTIFSGIDLTPYEAAGDQRDVTRQALGIAPNQLLVGAVGRLEPIKGFAYFIGAAQIVAKAHPDVRFVLVGDGALRRELTEVARPMGDQFRFLGLREDVPALMAAMDICVLPSLNEGMGRVLLEAGAAATPAVATKVGGVPDVVRHGETGLLVPPHDEEALAQGIMTILRDSEMRMNLGKEARAHVVPAYGVDRMVHRIEQLYDELIGEKKLDP
jgi:glycosyltransferase involved in cell wall biosynthesis